MGGYMTNTQTVERVKLEVTTALSSIVVQEIEGKLFSIKQTTTNDNEATMQDDTSKKTAE